MMADWEAKGPLDPNHVHVTAYPANVQVKPAKEEWLLCKRWWQYVVGW
jgi:hypothetical protein